MFPAWRASALALPPAIWTSTCALCFGLRVWTRAQEELQARLENRIDRLPRDEIILRLNRFDYEESKIANYDYVLKNDNLEKTVEIIKTIIEHEMKL